MERENRFFNVSESNMSIHSGLDALFAELDLKYFDGKLHNDGWRCIFMNLKEGHYGSAVLDNKEIWISKHADDLELRRTVLHEMVHAWLYFIGDPSHHARNESHGTVFAAEIARLARAGEDMTGEEQYFLCTDISSERLDAAVAAYLARQSQSEHPSGKYMTGGKWHPDKAEYQPCCAKIRAPSAKWRLSLLNHCRTVAHISRLFGVDTVALREAVKLIPKKD